MAESLGKMPFGKFRDQDIEEVPDYYLTWFIGEKKIVAEHGKLCEAIKKELQYRERFDCQIKGE